MFCLSFVDRVPLCGWLIYMPLLLMAAYFFRTQLPMLVRKINSTYGGSNVANTNCVFLVPNRASLREISNNMHTKVIDPMLRQHEWCHVA